ncbi:MAG TPA: prepilin-type N-terminal cleavage/methylation domain-containing protein [Capsulimonadaceae bacterium]|nr:prepilin-type N-terminal cleavage/methylation domain-containing protein [Capsulimonadaceae bacterium]
MDKRMARRRQQAGVTLLELMIVLIMSAILASALAYAFGAEARLQELSEARAATVDRTDAMEREITRLLRGARLSSVATDTASYFQGVTDSGQTDLGTNRITFTTTAPGVSEAAQYSTDDFTTQQQNLGPSGGLAEISLGTAPVGNAGDLSGLFERMQRPSDSDPTQGGTEWDLDPDIASIGFQFWDGQEWVSSWDTTTGTRRLPAAVQVSYTLNNDPTKTTHVFTVPIPASDVTAQNPMTVTTTTAAPATTTP